MRKRKLLTRVVLPLAVIAVVVVSTFLLKSFLDPSAEQTASDFFGAVEIKNAADLVATLSNEPRDIGTLAVELADGAQAEVWVPLKPGTSAAQLSSLTSAVAGVRGVGGIAAGTSSNSWLETGKAPEPTKLIVVFSDNRAFGDLVKVLAKSKSVRTNSAGGPDVQFPMELLASLYLSRLPDGARFTNVTYRSQVKGDIAAAIVTGGDILRVDKLGKKLPVSEKELEQFKKFPTVFEMREISGNWRIVSFGKK